MKKVFLAQRLVGLSMEDPTHPLDTPLTGARDPVSKPGCSKANQSGPSLWEESPRPEESLADLLLT